MDARDLLASIKAVDEETYKSGSLKDFHAQLRTEARAVMFDRPMIEGPVRIMVISVLPIPGSWSAKKRQLATNLLKAAEDACSSIVFADDKQVCEQVNTKVYGAKPRIEVTVEPIT